MLARLAALAGRLRHDERGSAMPLFGLGIVVMFGFGAFAIDGSKLYATKEALQVTADAAALAAARDLPNSGDVVATARRIAAANMPLERYGDVLRAADIEIGTWDQDAADFTPTDTNPNAVRITTRRAAANGNPEVTFLAGVLGVDTVDISVTSVALNRPPVPICILVLDPSRSAALKVWGSAEITANDCVIQVNSTAGDALAVGVPASIGAQRIMVAGGVSGTKIIPPAETGMPTVPDPLADLPAPPPSGSCASSNEIRGSKGTDTLVYPGTYCGGLRVKSNTNAVFQPGVYIIDNGTFEVDANATARGTGVFFYLKGPKGRLNLTGGASIDLSAPTSGTYAGIVFFAERGRSNITHNVRGNPNLHINGVLYAPSDHFDYGGSSDSAITVMIANTVEYQGNSSFQRYTERTTVPLPSGLEARGTTRLTR